MPIGLRRRGPDRTYNLLKLVNEVRLGCGLPPSATAVQGSGAEDVTLLAVQALNAIEQRLFDRCAKHLSTAETGQAVIVGQVEYDEPEGMIRLLANPHIADMELLPTDEDELRANGCDLEETGQPTHYYWHDGMVRLWPVPDSTFMADKLVSEGGNWYVAAVDHTAGEDGTASPSTDAVSWTQIEDMTALDAADFAWESGKRYLRGLLDMQYVKGLTLMVGEADVPTLPSQFYPALIAGAIWRVRAIRGIGDIADAKEMFEQLEKDRIRARRKDQSNPRERVNPWERA